MYEQVTGFSGHMSGPQSGIDRIVIHATVSPCEAGDADSVANYFRSPDSGGLAHYVVGPDKIIQCCPEMTACWHAPPNSRSIGIELCDPQAGLLSRWTDANHQSMFARAHGLVHDLAARHSVPLLFRNALALRNGGRGVTTHYEVSQAWHQSDHSDPGPGFSPFMNFLLGGAAGSPGSYPAAHPMASNAYPVLRLGSRGAQVQRLQTLLHIPADGVFGNQTWLSVRDFQHKARLAVDGIAGPTTLSRMRF